MDNYSDALMINTAYSIDNKTPLYSAFIARKNFIPGKTEIENKDFVGELESDSKYEKLDQVSELQDVVNGEINESFEYARYWNGYLIILRPLLLIFDYWQIRIVLILILAILAIWFLTLICKNFGKLVAIIWGFSLLSIEYFYVGLNLMNSIPVLIMMISSIILIKRFEKIKDISIMFFIIGICVGFFCLLDAPLITLGGVLILYLMLVDKYKNYTLKETIISIIKYCIIWLIGYVAIWVTKWILVDLIYNRNIIEVGIMQVLYRTVGKKFSIFYAIGINLVYILEPIMVILIFEILITLKYLKNINKYSLKKSIPYFLISIMPYAWYVILANHSSMHAFFSYRILYISILGILLGTYQMCFKTDAANK